MSEDLDKSNVVPLNPRERFHIVFIQLEKALSNKSSEAEIRTLYEQATKLIYAAEDYGYATPTEVNNLMTGPLDRLLEKHGYGHVIPKTEFDDF